MSNRPDIAAVLTDFSEREATTQQGPLPPPLAGECGGEPAQDVASGANRTARGESVTANSTRFARVEQMARMVEITNHAGRLGVEWGGGYRVLVPAPEQAAPHQHE